MKKELRGYQQDACKALDGAYKKGMPIPYASLITGTGKSLVLAALTNRYINNDERVIQLVPRKELVEQNYIEAFNYMDKKDALGIVCGQLSKKQNTKQAVIAMATSFVNISALSGKFDRLLIDECHRVQLRQEGDKGAYHKIIHNLLTVNPAMKIAGVTGTPYRLDQGELHETSHKTKPFFTHKVYDNTQDPGIKKLINEGYLSHIETLNANIKVNMDGVRVVGNDYDKYQSQVKFDAIIDDAVEDMRNHFDENNINTALIFTSSIANAQHVINSWGKDNMRLVCGDSSICTEGQRKVAIEWMKNGTGKRYIINVDILTEGYDYKALQCVVLLRATISPGLLVQMVGRIFRPHEDKSCGYLLDYGTNIERLTDGGIDNIIVPKVKEKRGEAPKKVCTAINGHIVCGHVNIIAAKKCSKCKAEFISLNEDGNYSMRTVAQAIAEKEAVERTVYEISSLAFESYFKTDHAMIKMLFMVASGKIIHTEYLCIEHTGSARGLAIAKIKSIMKNPHADWYQIGKFEGGHNVKNLLFLLNDYYDQYFKRIKTITLVKDGRFNKLLSWDF